MRLAVSMVVCFCALFSAYAQTTAGYILTPMDKLTVSIAQDPSVGKPLEISVSPLGDLTVQVSRCCEESVTVNVRGKTIEDAEKELKKRLEADFYKVATVQLRVIDPAPRRGQVLLTGAIRQSAIQFEPGKPKTLYEAFTEAGPTEYANWKKVKLDRAGVPIKFYDMAAVKAGDRTKDVELQDGDRITVEESFFKFR